MSAIDAEVFADARGRCESRWLEVACHAIERLEALLGQPVELGPYWINDHVHSASFCGRLRGKSSFPFVESDCWEAALGIVGGPGAWAYVKAFPFLRGRAVGAAGRHWYLGLSQGGRGPSAWRSEGWTSPDGPGEWEWVVAPGTVFDVFRLPARSRASAYRVGEDVLVELDVLVGRYELGSGLGLPDPNRMPSADVSFYSIERDGVPVHGNLVRPPGLPGFDDVRMRRHAKDVESPLTLTPTRHAIEGGWGAGAYEVVYRVEGLRQEEGNVKSCLSEPIRFRIESS